MRHPLNHRDRSRAEAVALYRASDRRIVQAIADRVGVNHETLREWITADSLNGKPAVLSNDERAELRRLRKAEREWQLQRGHNWATVTSPQLPRNLGQRIVQTVLILVIVAVGARVAAELLAPLLPGLAVAAVLIFVVWFVWRRRV